MIELVELEKRWKDFADRKVKVVAVSLEGEEDASATQADFPHLEIIADEGRSLSEAVAVIHKDSKSGGGDTSAPTTLLIAGDGRVRWVYRPDRVTTRLTPAELLAAIDREMGGD